MNYTEKEIQDAFRAGFELQWENEFSLTFQQEYKNFIKKLKEVKNLTIPDVVGRSEQLNCKHELNKMKEIISKVTGLRGQLQPIANMEVLNQLIDIQIRLENLRFNVCGLIK